VKILSISLLIGFSGLIFYLSHQHSLPAPSMFPQQDKLFHLIAYGVLALLTINTLKDYLKPYKLAVSCSFVFCALYGLSDEWHQSFVAGREASALDWLADCSGALLALSAYSKIQRRAR